MSHRIDQLWKTVGLRIRSERLGRDMSQERLAELVGLSRPSITNLEAGRQRMAVDDLIKIARVLQIKMSDLFRGF